MNRINPSEPFEFEWQGVKMRAMCTGCDLERTLPEIDEGEDGKIQINRSPDILRLECAVLPFIDINDKQEDNGTMMNNMVFLGEGAELAKKYALQERDSGERFAIEKGLLREDGTLTNQGLALLGQILLNKHRNEFYQVVQDLAGSKNGE